MKKPKITAGEWELGGFDIDGIEVIAGDERLCFVDDNLFDDSECEANAKAISAVPEMIDALIKARNCYQGVGDFELCGELMSQIVPEIDAALKKAGCEL